MVRRNTVLNTRDRKRTDECSITSLQNPSISIGLEVKKNYPTTNQRIAHHQSPPITSTVAARVYPVSSIPVDKCKVRTVFPQSHTGTCWYEQRIQKEGCLRHQVGGRTAHTGYEDYWELGYWMCTGLLASSLALFIAAITV